jgi:putative endonuclease
MTIRRASAAAITARSKTARTQTDETKTAEKRAAFRAGRAAEAAVAKDLVHRGFAILGTNVRLGRLEIDVVARQEDTVVVVEVRTRGPTAWQTGLESIARLKAKRVRAAGERLWRERFLRDPSVNRMRFDIAVVTYGAEGRPLIEYVRGVL